MKKVWKWFYNISFVWKLVILYTAVLLLPLSVLTGYSYVKMAHDHAEFQKYASRQGFDQAMSYLTYRFSRIIRLFGSIQTDTTLNRIFSSGPVNNDIVVDLSNGIYIRNYLKNVTDESEKLFPQIYLKENFSFVQEGTSLLPMALHLDEEWMQESLKGWGWLTFFSPEPTGLSDTISVTRPIRNLENYRDIVAVLRVDIPLKEIEDVIHWAATTPYSSALIIDENGNIVAASNSVSDLHDAVFMKELMDVMSSAEMEEDFIKKYGLSSVISGEIPGTEWFLVSLRPNLQDSAAFGGTPKSLFIVMVIVILTGLLLSLPIARSISKGIFALDKRMKMVEQGDMSTRFTPNSHDEIGRLMMSFNYMLSRLENMDRERNELNESIRTAELMALQSQINPHFLYNTLEMISWMARSNMSDEIQTVIHAMARFYRLSLNQGRDIITIGEEVEMLRSYVQIQQMRFRDSIVLNIDISEVDQFLIPKITLQPIVENAILHGILEKPSKKGKIAIKGFLCDGNIILEITDDGIGMDEEMFESIIRRSGTQNKVQEHYGLHNIEKRVCIFFGLEKGLICRSSPESGTCIKMVIPALLGDDERLDSLTS